MSVKFNLIFVFCLIAGISCQKDDFLEAEGSELIPYEFSTQHISGSMVSVDVAGRIDGFGTILPATVRMGNKTAIVDEYYNFILTDVMVDSLRASYEVEFANGNVSYRSFIPNTSALNLVRPTMISYSNGTSQLELSLAFDRSAGWSRFRYPMNSVVSQGQLISGPGYVLMNGEAADDEFFLAEVSGDLVGHDENGALKFLYPYSYLRVQGYDLDGNELELAPGTEGKVDLTVGSTFLAEEEQFGSIWKYDESTTTWREIGQGERFFTENYFQLEVDAYGQYMAAKPKEPFILSGRLVSDESQTPVPRKNVEIFTEDFAVAITTTDERGRFRAWVPGGVPLGIRTTILTEELLLSADLNVDHDLDLGDLEVSESLIGVVKGRHVDCYGNPVPGYVYLLPRHWRSIDEGGNFTIVHSLDITQPLRTFDTELEQTADQMTIQFNVQEVVETGPQVSCDWPSTEYLIYQINGSEELTVNDNVTFELTSLGDNNVINLEFEGMVNGDLHNLSLSTWDLPNSDDTDNPLTEPIVLTISNNGEILGRFQNAEDFQFETLGISERSGSNIMFTFSGTMNSTLGAEDITVSGIGRLLRP